MKKISFTRGAERNEYYTLKRMLKIHADYMMIIGKRSNGKTYSVIQRALSQNMKIAYIRRFEEEIQRKNVFDLFAPHDIEKYTNGEWNTYVYQSHCFYFAYAENGKIARKALEPFCHCFALNTMETTKGADRGYFPIICFDEFITRRFYLPNEFVLFQNLLSSIMRDRVGSEIYMLANTVSQSCPYFAEMGISRIDKLKQGDIQIIDYGNTGLRVAVEYCNDTENTKSVSKYFAFDNPQLSMITNGKWEIKSYPHCPISVNRNNTRLVFFVMFDERIIRGNLVVNDGDMFILFTPHTNPNREITRRDIVYSLDVSPYPLWSQQISECPTPAHQVIKNLIDRNKMYYSDNTVGEFIRNWIKSQAQVKQNLLS